MNDNTISIEKIKACLSMLSMAVLSVQHIVGLWADKVQVSYIPLVITFFTIFIGTLGTNSKAIRICSLIGFVIIGLPGMIMYMISYHKIDVSSFEPIYTKILYGGIGGITLILAMLYIKKMNE